MTTQQNFPQYQSFICLDNNQAETLMLNYKTYVETQGPNLINLFINPVGTLLGYELSLSDYITMISLPGVATWKLRFAYEQSEQGGMIQFLLVGCTSQGSRMTPYFQLKNRKLVTTLSNEKYKENSFTKVPSSLMNPWKGAYSSLINEGKVPTSLLQSPWDSGNTLQGYNFNFSDFLDILYNNNQELPSTSIIELRIVNHAEHSAGETQHTKPGMIGVAIVSVDPGATPPVDGYTFYDISKPCPPTC